MFWCQLKAKSLSKQSLDSNNVFEEAGLDESSLVLLSLKVFYAIWGIFLGSLS